MRSSLRQSLLVGCSLLFAGGGVLAACGSDQAQPAGDAGNDASQGSDSPVDAPVEAAADAADVAAPDASRDAPGEASPGDAAREAGDAQLDAPIDVGADATPAPPDAAHDAAGDAATDAPSCPSIAQACGDGGVPGLECVQSWSVAGDPRFWCSQFPNARLFMASSCDGFDLVSINGVDTSTVYYYDAGSGQLVGIEGRAIPAVRCIAGVSPDVPFNDCGDAALTPILCLSDGGVAD